MRNRPRRVVVDKVDEFNEYMFTYPSLTAYWGLQEVSGSVAASYPNVAMNGTIVGATVGQSTGIRIPFAYDIDSINDYIDIYSVALNSALDPTNDISLNVLATVDSAAWTDGATRRIVTIEADTNNKYTIQKSGASNLAQVRYHAGGVNKTITYATSTTDIFMITMTVSPANDRFRMYFNGVLVNELNSLGVYVGSLDATKCVIGASSTIPANVHSGLVAGVSLFSSELTQAEISTMFRKSGAPA